MNFQGVCNSDDSTSESERERERESQGQGKGKSENDGYGNSTGKANITIHQIPEIEFLIDEEEEASLPVETEEESEGSTSGLKTEDRSAGGRYFGGGEGGPKCFNCGTAGHISKDCPEAATLPCYLCGTPGHQRSQCREEICYNCGRVGHMSRVLPSRLFAHLQWF